MDVSELIKDINAVADAPPGTVKEEERAQLISACGKLKGNLEAPFESTVRIIFAAHEAIALRLGIDMKLFDVTAVIGGDIHIKQLAEKTGADALLVTRVMRLLAGMGLYKETAYDTFVMMPNAGVYVTGSPLKEAVIHITSQIDIIARLPTYFAEKGYKNPSDAYDGPFQFAMGTKDHYFDWLRTRPVEQHAFNVVMGISRMNRGEEWFEFYPVEKKLRVSESETLLVDIGGGLGHDLIALKQKFPNLPGKLIVQDIPIVIDAIKDLPQGIEAMKHDFLTPQPIKGAKAYYLRTVLHDWPDKQAKQILKNTKFAMNKDSILLINENVLPDSNVPLYSAELDLSMMADFSSLDRTQTQFKELLESAGFELVNVWAPGIMVPGSGTLFEAMVKS